MFCSTIIPTVNRPTLARAVYSVLEQDFRGDEFEVIVVNDSGLPLAEADWQHSPRVRVIATPRRERCVARNTGAAIASGRYLHFLDDDALLLPGALEAFWKLAQKAKAAWLFGSWQTIDNSGALIDEFRPALDGNIFALLVAGEGLPLQASIVRSDRFFEAGGFDPSPESLGTEDRDLGRRRALRGAVAYVPTVVAQVRVGEHGSTTRWATLANNDRWGREKALNDPAAFCRLRSSSISSYWRGRVCRALFGSSLWNLERKNLLRATSRIGLGLTLGARSILSADFWRGIRSIR